MRRILLLIALAAAACGGTLSPTTQPPPPPTSTTPVSATCPDPAHVLDGIYHPTRLNVLDPCRTLGVTVMGFRSETDGDLHIYTKPDDPNLSYKPGAGGWFIVEYMMRDGGHLPTPIVGQHLTVTGAYNLDADHGWNELHPVFQVKLDSGATYVSGPQFGGSPAGDSSSTAAADCTTPSGAHCVGYPGVSGLTGTDSLAKLRHAQQGVQPSGDSAD